MALRLTTGAFLASHRYSGDLIALNGPIRKDRDLKLFSLREIAAPSYALDYWPVRCHLKTQDGLYLSNTARKLATNAEVHCCSEELILDLSGDVTIAGNSALTQSCLWSSNATYLASMEASTSQLLFQSQHSCFGRETFGVQLFSGGNELALTQQVINDGETEAGVVCKWPSVRCSPGAKPTRLTLEIASKPVFLITAHGGFAAASDSRPASATVCTLPRQTINPSADALTLASWQFEHRGDNLYTIQHLGTKNPLYVGHAGTLRMDGNHPPFPDSRLLFNVQLTWTKSDGVCKKEGGESAEQSIAGFAIKSLFKLNGKQLYLSALPDGRIATCYSKSHPSRWELFGVADREAVLNSGARPLSRLPLHPVTTPPAEPAMRRSSSCNAIPGNSGSSLLSTSPPSTLPGILENFDEESSSCTEEEEEELTETMAAQLSALLPTTSGALLRERRCASESALTQLQTCGKVEEPKWLADLRRIPARPSGWDVRSGATMQEQSCQSLCSEALRNAGENPEESPTNNVEAAGPLPEEVKSRVVNKLQEITATPEPAKLSYPHLAKAAAHGTAPEWSQSLLVHDVQEETLPEELTEVGIHDSNINF